MTDHKLAAYQGIVELLGELELLDGDHTVREHPFYAAVDLFSGDRLRIAVDEKEQVIQWMRLPDDAGRWSFDVLQTWPLDAWQDACEAVIRDHLAQEAERAKVAARRCAKISAWLAREVDDGPA